MQQERSDASEVEEKIAVLLLHRPSTADHRGVRDHGQVAHATSMRRVIMFARFSATRRLLALFGVLWLIAAVASDGFLEDDAWTHYLYARFAPVKPAYLFDVWGRPICTGLYALAAPWAGMAGCRGVSLLLLVACLWLTMRTARALKIYEHVTAAFIHGHPIQINQYQKDKN
jgi:hypothetical protein